MMYKIILFWFLVFGTKLCLAQQTNIKSRSERISYFENKLSITEGKAAEVVSALDYNKDKLQNTISDKSITPQEKHRVISRLITERQAKLNTLLTEQQMIAFNMLLKDRADKLKQSRINANKKRDMQLSKPLQGVILRGKTKNN